MSKFTQRLQGRPALIAAAAGLLIVGGGAGALAVDASRPSVTMAPATPVAIASLKEDRDTFGRPGIITIRGRVAEVYGNKFVMSDASGRALVDLGREGEDAALVAAGAPVTVQGRFDHGFVHAAFLVGADGKVVALGPVGGPRGHEERGHGHRRGDHDGRGPDGDRDPTPAAPAAPAAAVGAPSSATPD